MSLQLPGDGLAADFGERRRGRDDLHDDATLAQPGPALTSRACAAARRPTLGRLSTYIKGIWVLKFKF